MLLSLCMIVKNEADIISGCLKSVKGIADEMIVVDTGSTDGTAALAENMGAKVYNYEWNDSFSDARNFSLSKASGDWILVMDADDILEPSDREKVLGTVKNAPADVDLYCFRTLCYSGKAPSAENVLINLNIRLIRNGRGFSYKGRIHEQVCPSESNKGKYKIAAADIRVHHYGYLDCFVKKKDKRGRNIALIQKELDEAPDDAFMLFNMGNEYLTLGMPEKALSYYRQSCERFDPAAGFSSSLLIRMAAADGYLHRYGDIVGIAKLGAKYYPELTDFVYIMADAFLRLGKTRRAENLFKKCVKMGPAPLNANGSAGTGTFKPHFALGGIYLAEGNRGKALWHYRRAVKYCPYFTAAYAAMAGIYTGENMQPDKIRKKLMRAAGAAAQNTAFHMMLSDILYDRGFYEQALKSAKLAAKASPENCAAYYNEGVCLFYMGKYREAYAALLKAGGSAFVSKSAFFRMLCTVLDSGIKKSEGVFFEKKLDFPYYRVLEVFARLSSGYGSDTLSDWYGTPAIYEKAIFGLLEVLLRAGRTKDFQKALLLLNLITDDTVLLSLGKLYYKYGYYSLAYKELERSVRLTGKIDGEGIKIMKNTLGAACAAAVKAAAHGPGS